MTYEEDLEDANVSLTSINDTSLATKSGQLEEFYEFTWDKWREPNYHERLKQSYYIMQDEFSRYK